jgi:hypothetical protein
MHASDIQSRKATRPFRSKAYGPQQRLDAVHKVLGLTGDVRKRATATVVLEQLLFKYDKLFATQHGVTWPTRELASYLGLSPSAINRALETLTKANLIGWCVKRHYRAPTRHLRLLPRLLRLLKMALKGIRKIDPPKPENPLSFFIKPKGEAVNNAKSLAKMATQAVGRWHLDALRQLTGSASNKSARQ